MELKSQRIVFDSMELQYFKTIFSKNIFRRRQSSITCVWSAYFGGLVDWALVAVCLIMIEK